MRTTVRETELGGSPQGARMDVASLLREVDEALRLEREEPSAGLKRVLASVTKMNEQYEQDRVAALQYIDTLQDEDTRPSDPGTRQNKLARAQGYLRNLEAVQATLRAWRSVVIRITAARN